MKEELEILISELIAAIPNSERRTTDFTHDSSFKASSESWNDVEEAILDEQQSRNYLGRGDVKVCGWFDKAALVMVGRGNGEGRTCHIVALAPKGVVIHFAKGLRPGDELTNIFANSPQNCKGLRNIVEYLQKEVVA